MRLFRWTDFVVPSSLNTRLDLNVLIEPIELQETRERIQLGLHEALINAVVHGNSNAPEKIIRIRRIITPNWLIWQIQDQGNGIKHSQRNFNML